MQSAGIAGIAALRPRSIALILCAILALYGLETHARRRALSPPGTLGDQSAYLGYARHLYESNYTITEDRNRMPVFPFLLSLIYRPDLTEAEFLNRAQVFNVNLSIVLLAALFFIFRRFFGSLLSLALVALTGFGVFLYRAPIAQTEVLFYFISFCGFVLLLRMLVTPRWWLAILAGTTIGVAHLTKASVLPALGVWIVAFAVQIIWGARNQRWSDLARRSGMLLVVTATFLTVVFPYIQTSKRIYGAYLYNVNSTFVMWFDSSTTAHDFLRDHDKDLWRVLPPEQLPSASKYWREHSGAQIAHRLWRGLLDLSTQNAMAIGYYKFVVALASVAVILILRGRERFPTFLSGGLFPAFYCLMFFGAYVVLYAWYDAIINDTRFVLAIFLPFIFAATLLVLRLGTRREVTLFGRRWPFSEFLACLLFALAAIDLLYNARYLVRY